MWFKVAKYWLKTHFCIHQLLSSAIFIFISELVVPRIPKRPKHVWTQLRLRRWDQCWMAVVSTAIFSMGWRVLYQRFGKVSMNTSKGFFAKTQATEAVWYGLEFQRVKWMCRGAKTRALSKRSIQQGFCDTKVAVPLWDSPGNCESCAPRNWCAMQNSTFWIDLCFPKLKPTTRGSHWFWKKVHWHFDRSGGRSVRLLKGRQIWGPIGMLFVFRHCKW